MAKSEHQGLQISLILFAMVSVVLAITTFVYYRSSEEAAKAAEDAKKKMEAATTRANDFQARFDYAMNILGQTPLPEAEVEQLKQSFGNDEKMKAVITNYETFINSFGAGMPKDKLTYAAVAPEVLTALRGAMNSLQQQTEEAAKLAKESEANRLKEIERTDVAVKGHKTADDQRGTELDKYTADRTVLENTQKTDLARYNAELAKKNAELDAEKKKGDLLNKTIQTRESTISDQTKTIKEMRDEPFEVPDGQVTWVNQGANTVWINLGMADGLRRQTLFSVYDQADNGVTRTTKKASVEVTRVIDQHLAEARIVSDSPANPILQGDQIFSPAWRPGKRVRFALAGKIDIDNDQRSDRNLVRSLLAASGGQIDAELHDDGQIEGEMTSATRYLVLGEQPDERTDRKLLDNFAIMRKKAEELGIETIGVDELLDWVGYRPEARTIGLGKNADPNQFKPKPAEGKAPTSTGAVSEKFRERRPSDKANSKKKDSAFDK